MVMEEPPGKGARSAIPWISNCGVRFSVWKETPGGVHRPIMLACLLDVGGIRPEDVVGLPSSLHFRDAICLVVFAPAINSLLSGSRFAGLPIRCPWQVPLDVPGGLSSTPDHLYGLNVTTAPSTSSGNALGSLKGLDRLFLMPEVCESSHTRHGRQPFVPSCQAGAAPDTAEVI
ncbi:hypothetical protein LZ30DRAFT_691880 [Colletotrichum cereale]|nr:hypothetical protein LZ30DRAFT_691880 [Colletotrichum cereale]